MTYHQNQIDADNEALVPWRQWDDVHECAHLQRTNSSAVVRICDVQFRHLYWTLVRVCLLYRLQDAGEGPTKLQ